MAQEEYKSFKLSGVIKKVLYKNEETKYIIAVLENNQKICGAYFDTDIEKIVGEEVILKGNWTTHKKYGVQFEFDTLELKEAEIFFFLTKIRESDSPFKDLYIKKMDLTKEQLDKLKQSVEVKTEIASFSTPIFNSTPVFEKEAPIIPASLNDAFGTSFQDNKEPF